MGGRIKHIVWLAGGAWFGLFGCASPALVEPEHDLVRDHQAEIAELRTRAEAYCAGDRGGVGSLQIRVKKTDQGARISMEATCKEGDAMIRCHQDAEGTTGPTCDKAAPTSDKE